jgi:anti-sigma regulatory factor (Ser/Thr protein kinase)
VTSVDHDSPAPGSAEDLLFGTMDLHTVRDLVRCCARLAGLDNERAEDLVLAVHEVAVCAFAAEELPARLLITTPPGRLVCEITEPETGPRQQAGPGYRSRLTDPGVGPGRGWRIARILCDEIQAAPDGTALRLCMRLPPVPEDPGRARRPRPRPRPGERRTDHAGPEADGRW